MATYTGTSGNNSYTGTADADSIVGNGGNDSLLGNGGNDTIFGGGTVNTTNLDLNWNSQGGDGTNLAGGFTQNTGGINVAVSYTDLGPGTAFRVETSSGNAAYVAPGETFNTRSNAYLGATGTGDASMVAFDFSAVNGSGLQNEVTNVAFRLSDIDAFYGTGWMDEVRLVAYDADGNEVPVTLTAAGADVVSGQSVTAANGNNSPNVAEGSVLVNIAGPVSRIELVYGNGLAAGQFMQITDVQFTATATDRDTIRGGDGNDVIDGGSDSDMLFGDAGNDNIDGGLGADTIDGGTGEDTIWAGAGDDSIFGGAGDNYDYLNGGAGNDTIDGGGGNDVIYGVGGNDLIFGGTGSEYIDGGDDNDTIDAGDSNDTVVGGAGDDSILGGAGDDSLNGGDGNDTISGGFDTDRIIGGLGNDFLMGDEGDDTLYGSEGMDTLNGGIGNDFLDGGDDADTIYGGDGADSVIGGAGDDLMTGDAGNDTLLGGDGNDTMGGGDDADLISGDAGNDSLGGDAGNDTISGGIGDDAISGGADNDSLSGDDGNDTISGDQGDDTVSGGAGDDELYGGDGADVLDGGIGADLMNGATGDDTFLGGAGVDTMNGGTGMDWVDYSASGAAVNVALAGSVGVGGDAEGDTFTSVDAIRGSAFNDSLVGYDAENTVGPDFYTNILDGGEGDDYIDGRGGSDSLYGGSGNDTILGGAGNDYIEGGAGVDSIIGGLGADTIVLNSGESAGDILEGGEDNADEALDTAIDTIVINGRAKIIYDPTDSENGVIRWANGETTSFSNIENITHVPCFTPGTLIETLTGPVLVEEITLGDKILTRDNGYQEVRWVGRRDFSAADLVLAPHLCPVRIAAGALGNGLPQVDMIVSPQHRMLVGGQHAELLFGESEVLAAAIHLVGQPGITRLAPRAVSYLHVMFDAHEIILADGAWSESFQPGDMTVAGMDDAARAELFEIFPELRAPQGRKSYAAARLSLKAHEVRVLLAA